MTRSHRRAHFWVWLFALPASLALLALALYARHASIRELQQSRAAQPSPLQEPRP